MIFQTGQKLLFIGDSITDCGRARPHGEGLGGALGNGYVQMVDALLGVTNPQMSLRIVNNGSSGNTVRDLQARWNEDVLELRPDWLSVMIGTNDVWRQFDSARQSEIQVLPDEYETTLRELISSTRSQLQGLILMTPFYIEPLREDKMRARMDEYGAIVRRIAHEHDAIFVDTQAAFDAVLEDAHSSSLAWDRVHPNAVGHMVIARAFLNAVGFSWS